MDFNDKNLEGQLDNTEEMLDTYEESLDLFDNPELDKYLNNIEQGIQGESIEHVNATIDQVIENTINMDPIIEQVAEKMAEQAPQPSADTEKALPESSLEKSIFDDNITDFEDEVFKADAPKKNNTIIIIVVVVALLVGLATFAVLKFTGVLGKKDNKVEPKTTEVASQEPEATTEEATTEDDLGPFASRDYIKHDFHTTDNTIEFGSNPYSLVWGAGPSAAPADATQEDLYPATTITPVAGSKNETSPASNVAEEQTLTSRYMVLVDLSDDSIVAKRDSDVVVNPASMTKILTVLTASDMVEDLDDTFVMTQEAVSYAYDNGCSSVGFLPGEKVTVKDLMYGTIVCSGGDAAVGLATYCCGSQEAFVEKMNAKAEELGISDTAHFTNVVGVYNEDLHCTMEDMAVILSAAIQNDLCREILNARTYTTTPDPDILPEFYKNALANGQSLDEIELPEGSTEEPLTDGQKLVATTGIPISNWFLRRIEDKATGGEVICAKTGFVNAAGFCCASYYKSESGKEYICVTGDTYSSWRCIFDHVGIYRSLAK